MDKIIKQTPYNKTKRVVTDNAAYIQCTAYSKTPKESRAENQLGVKTETGNKNQKKVT